MLGPQIMLHPSSVKVCGWNGEEGKVILGCQPLALAS
jgi:hypothetical protein